MNKSDSIKNLAAALNKAQEAMGGAAKDANNPFFKSKYADLGSVIRAIKQPFADNGLSYTQFPVSEENNCGVDTILMHSSGEWIESRLLLPMVKADPQKAGSAITYARRYALQAIAGIPSEDDDGNAASQGNHQPKAKQPPKQAPKQPGFTDKDVSDWMELDQNTKNHKWESLSPALANAINARVASGN